MNNRRIHPPILPDGTHGTVVVAMSADEYSRALRTAELDGFTSVADWLRSLAIEREVLHALRRRRRRR